MQPQAQSPSFCSLFPPLRPLLSPFCYWQAVPEASLCPALIQAIWESREISEPSTPNLRPRGSPPHSYGPGQWRGQSSCQLCQEVVLEEEGLEPGLGRGDVFAGAGVENGIPDRRKSLWVWGPSDSTVAAESEEETLALAGVAQLAEHSPVHRKVSGSIPD